jgi:cytidyltransferase-like protein
MWGGAIYSNQTAVLAFAGVVAAVGWWYAERRYAELQARLERPRRGVSFAPEARTPRAVGDGGGGGGGAPPPSGPIRIYLDGCFDMLHYGHANALRQAKASGHVLVVGLVNDEEIVVNKGTPPVMCEEERYAALAACKFVDEVIRNAPYNLHKDWVDKLVSEHRITYIVHGDDPCFTADGQDAYAYAKQIGVYKQVKRTEGVSTTDIVGRMLLMTKEHHVPPAADDEEKSSGRMSPTGSLRSSSLAANEEGSGGGGSLKRGGSQELLSASLPGAGVDSEDEELAAVAAAGGSAAQEARDAAARRLQRARMDAIRAALPSNHSRFLPTARRISQFADGRVPGPEDTVVYMPGSWDLFNCGHVAALAAARKLGTFLLVGVYDDPTINKLRGSGRPILNLYERALSLLSCKCVLPGRWPHDPPIILPPIPPPPPPSPPSQVRGRGHHRRAVDYQRGSHHHHEREDGGTWRNVRPHRRAGPPKAGLGVRRTNVQRRARGGVRGAGKNGHPQDIALPTLPHCARHRGAHPVAKGHVPGALRKEEQVRGRVR